MKIHPVFSATRHSYKRGFTLAEIAIVLGIVGILIAAIWVAASSVHRQNAVNQAMQELQTVSQNMVTLYLNRTLPAAALGGCPALPDITANVIAGGVVPGMDILGGACPSAINPWSNAAGSLVISSVAGNRFGVKFLNVPRDGCIGLLLQGTSCDPSQAGCPVSTSVTGVDPSTTPVTTPAGTPSNWSSMTPTQAVTDCGTGGATIDSVEFDFQL